MQPFDKVSAVALHDTQRYAGIAFDRPSREPRRNHAAHRRDEAQHDASRRCPARRLDIVADLVDLPDDTSRSRKKKPAGLGQHHTAAVPAEQLGAQFMLEKLDLTAERGLRYPQRIGSFAEASELRHAIEGPELTEIHLANLGTLVNTL